MKLPRLVVADGSIEALKWLALLLMTGDHVNKYLLNGANPLLFNMGRMALPIFCFVLAYNLARPDTLQRGIYGRTMTRLTLFGLAATPAFLALGGLWAGWWPLNVMFTLLAATAVLRLIDQGSRLSLIAAATVFLCAGTSVEFWWPALSICLTVWWYCRKPSLLALSLLIASCAALWFINGNYWALAAVPVIVLSTSINLRILRIKLLFYYYYPIHLSVLWLIRFQMMKTGYLFY